MWFGEFGGTHSYSDPHETPMHGAVCAVVVVLIERR